MTKRWMQRANLEINDATGAVLVETDDAGGGGTTPPVSLAGGTKTVASTATPQALVASATPCKFVWLAARVDSNGNPLNTKPVFIGDGSNQNIPLLPSNYEGLVIQIDDAAKLYVKVGVNGQGVAYRIFA